MQKWLLTGVCAVLSVTNANAQGGAYAERVQKYIEQYRDLAVAEQIRSGVPASITLAQGIHETSAGTSELATEANNHFGIKCKKSWTGQTFAHTDDAPNECFRKYNSSTESYKDHSDYLASQPRYANLFKLSATDYAAWAIGLRQAGYATNPRYAFVLIGLIEDYKLQEYTYAALNDGTYGNYAVVKKDKEVVPIKDPVATNKTAATGGKITPAVTTPTPVPAAVVAATPGKPAGSFTSSKNSRLVVKQTGNTEDPELAANPKPQYGQVVNVNGLRAVYAKKGDMALEYAFKHSIRYAKLLEMNDIEDKPLPADMYLYLEKKHSKGVRPMHMVKPGESMLQVAQAEGVQLKSLRALNMMAPGQEPMPGTTLELQRSAASRPLLVGEAAPVNTMPVEEPVQEITKPQPQVVAKTRPATTQQSTSRPSGTVVKTLPPVQKPVAAPVVAIAPVTTRPVADNNSYVEKSKIEQAKTPAEEAPANTTIRKKREDYIASTVPAATAPVTQPPAAKPVETKYVNEEDNKHQEVGYANKVEAVKPQPDPVKTAPVQHAVVKEEIKEEPLVVTPPAKAVEPVITEPVKKEEPIVVEEEEDEPVKEPVREESGRRKRTPKNEEVAASTPPAAKEPADELDALKAKFDMVVYTDSKKTEPVAEVKKEDAKPTVAKPTTPAATAPAQGAKFYTVQKGDTAFSIAKANDITVRQLMEWNNLDFEAIKVGQKLRVK